MLLAVRRQRSRSPRVAPTVGAVEASHWRPVVATAIVTLVAYANAVSDQFALDDIAFSVVARNANLRLLVGLFGEDAWFHTRHVVSGVYRPLALATIVFESLLHGGAARALHLTNILLHVATTLVLGGFLSALVRDARGRGSAPLARGASLAPWCAASVFGVHPVHTEAVDSIFNRSEVLATLGVVGALWIVWRHRRKLGPRVWVAVSALFFVALFSKESGVTLPLLIVVVVGVLAPEPWRLRVRQLARVAYLAVPLGLYLAARESAVPWPAMGPSRLEVYLGSESWSQRWTMVASTTLDAWKLLLWPHPLRVFHDTDPVHRLALSAPVHAAIVGAALALWRRFPPLLAGVAGFYVAILPSTRLATDLSPVVQVFAERYVYLPSAMAAIPLAFGFARLAERWGWRSLVATAAIACTLLSARTIARNQDWHGDIALFSAECAVDLENNRATLYLARSLLDSGRSADLAAFCRRYLARHPNRTEMLKVCARGFEREGRLDDGEAALMRVWTRDGTARALIVLARFHERVGDRERSEIEFQLGLSRRATPFNMHMSLGEMIARRLPARMAEARAEFEAAAALNPRSDVPREWIRRIDAHEPLP